MYIWQLEFTDNKAVRKLEGAERERDLTIDG
jgi:hypothetical protein